MTRSGLSLWSVASRLLHWVELAAPNVRTAVDRGGDPRELSDFLRRAIERGGGGMEMLLEPSARRDLLAYDAKIGAAIEGVFRAPWAEEAEARAQMARLTVDHGGVTESVAEAMRRYRGADEAARAGARVGIESALGKLGGSAAFDAIREWRAAPPGAAPGPSGQVSAATSAAVPADTARGLGSPVGGARAATSAAPPADTARGLGSPLGGARAATSAAPPADTPRGLIVSPSAELIATLSADPASVHARDLAMGATPLAMEATTRASHALGGAPVAPHLQDGLQDLFRALAEDVFGRVPSDFAGLRAARAGFDVADFRPSLALMPIRWLETPRALPFEQPLVPITRPGARVEADLDASSAIACLLGSGEPFAGGTTGSALALSAPTRVFVERGLRERPTDRVRARRTFALEIVLAYVDSEIGASAAGDAEALRDGYQDAVGCAPPEGLARCWALEAKLAALPGEARSLYARSAAVRSALVSGVALGRAIREAFDEDWFRNPRATGEALRVVVEATPAGAETDFVPWVEEAVS